MHLDQGVLMQRVGEALVVKKAGLHVYSCLEIIDIYHKFRIHNTFPKKTL